VYLMTPPVSDGSTTSDGKVSSPSIATASASASRTCPPAWPELAAAQERVPDP